MEKYSTEIGRIENWYEVFQMQYDHCLMSTENSKRQKSTKKSRSGISKKKTESKYLRAQKDGKTKTVSRGFAIRTSL